jgi:quaternary ammonium compound-resistance protein SugE
MPWIYLVLAGACEMVWPLGFKYTNGFTEKYWAIALTFAMMLTSFGLMSLATKGGIHVGTAYAVWTGLGATGTAILGMMLFNEPRDFVRLMCLGLIIMGVVGLKFFSPPEQAEAGGAAVTQPAGETKGGAAWIFHDSSRF